MEKKGYVSLCTLIWALSGSVAADVLIGPTYSVYADERLESQEGFRVEFEHQETYIWGSYESPDSSFFGQPMGNIDLIGFGAGIRYRFDKAYMFADLGYYLVDVNPTQRHRDEFVVTALEFDHGPIPFQPTHTTYELDDGYGVRAGIGYEFKYADVQVAYRSLSLNEGYRALSGPECIDAGPATCWENHKTLKVNALQLSVLFRF